MDKIYCDICGVTLSAFFTLEFGKFYCKACGAPYDLYDYNQHGKMITRPHCLFKKEDYAKYKMILKQFEGDLSKYSTDPKNKVLAKKKENVVAQQRQVDNDHILTVKEKLEGRRKLSLDDVFMCVEYEEKTDRGKFSDVKIINEGVVIVSNLFFEGAKFYSNIKLHGIYVRIHKASEALKKV